MLRRRLPSHHLPIRTFIDARVPWVRDRALDHAVEKEKHLLPFLNLKDHLILSSPSSSTPLSSITPHHSSLLLPFRPLRFLRLFPSSFLEHFPSQSPHHPHFSPSPPLLKLHEEEQFAYSSCKQESADRLLRLLMLSPRRRLPISLIHRIRFDLGLPPDFARSLFPLFPDYFQLVPSSNSDSTLDVELVCYIADLAQSAMERYAVKTGGYKKGTPLAFPLKFSRGFEMEKKVRKWVEEWQRLPYVSPYEDGSRLPTKSDVWEKWAVGLVHEILSLMVGRKMEKGNLEMVVGCLGLNPTRFRRLVMNHAGIFYVSNKIRRQTVVLREGYRRDLLVEKHPLMGLRYHYMHLMRKGKEESGKKKGKKKGGRRSVGEDNDEVDEEEEDDDEEDEDEEEGDEDDEILEGEEFDSGDEESDDEDEGYDGSWERVRQGPRRVPVEKDEPKRPFVRGSPVDGLRDMKGRRNEMGRKSNGEGRSYGMGNSSSRGRQRIDRRNRVST